MEMGGRGLINCGGCIRIEANNLGWYIRNSVEPLIKGVQTAETIEYNNTVNKKEFKQLDNGKEGTMEKQNNVWVVCKRNARNNGWKTNMELAEKNWPESWNGSHVACRARTDSLNKLCETQGR